MSITVVWHQGLLGESWRVSTPHKGTVSEIAGSLPASMLLFSLRYWNLLLLGVTLYSAEKYLFPLLTGVTKFWLMESRGRLLCAKEKGKTEDEMVGWLHQLNGHKFEESSGRWRTGKPGVLQSMGSQRVGHDWVTEQQLSRFSSVRFFATLWMVAHQAPPSMELSRQEYWSGLSCPLAGDLLYPGMEPESRNVSCIRRQVLCH